MNNHPWWKLSGFKKRIHGFFTYQLWSFVSLWNPEVADILMWQGLKQQFEEKEMAG